MFTVEEDGRLDALRNTAMMDTPPDPQLDEVTALLAEICEAPIALITLIDESRQWFKSKVGLPFRETPREYAFCEHLLRGPELLIVPDTLEDPRFLDNPLVAGAPGIRFYAGAPLALPSGHVLGALCVLDRVPRTLNAQQTRALRVLSRRVAAEIELRRIARRKESLRKQFELQNQELLEAQAVAHIGSWIADASTFDARWSEQTHRIFSTDPGQPVVPYDAFLGRVHQEDRHDVDARFRASLARAEPNTFEHRIVLSSGAIRTVEERWRIVRDDKGEPQKAIGTCYDITDRRDAENKILRLNRVYALLSGINGAIVQVRDRHTLYARVCEIAVNTGGLKAAWIGLRASGSAELVKVGHAGRIAPSLDASRFLADESGVGTSCASAAIRTGQPVICNDLGNALGSDTAMSPWQREALDQGYRASAAFPLTHDSIAFGAVTLYADAAGFFDATETKLLGELIDNIAFALDAIEQHEQRVEAQAERQAIEQQLLRAQRMESIGTLAGGIAHDLNNVLTPIVFSIDMLRDALDEPQAGPVLDEIARSARRGADMVRQLLVFARGSTGERRATAIDTVLGEMLATVRETFPRTISILTHIAPGLSWVEADRTQLYQVLLNLCLNARDAMRDGGELRLDLRQADFEYGDLVRWPEAKVGRYVVITVEDSGHGIPPDVMSRIFDPFYTTKPNGKGSGLGLSTARSIVGSHGGFMSVTSVPGMGSRFSVYLPAIAQGERTPIHVSAIGPRRGNGESLLLVDDEESIRVIASTVIASFGYQVTVAANGAEALALIAAGPNRFDTVVTDIMMPVMDGLQFMREARRLRPDLRIIASSGVDDDAHRRAAEDEGAAAFLAKPYSADAMLSTLQRILAP